MVDRAPYHFVLTDDARPANSRSRKAMLSDWLAAHEDVPDDWAGNYWRKGRTRAQMLAVARQKPPTPIYLVQNLARPFDVAILISPVSHPDLSSIEMVWATIRGALCRAKVEFSMSLFQELKDQEFKHISAEAWCRY